jgi:hypothetical protein
VQNAAAAASFVSAGAPIPTHCQALAAFSDVRPTSRVHGISRELVSRGIWECDDSFGSPLRNCCAYAAFVRVLLENLVRSVKDQLTGIWAFECFGDTVDNSGIPAASQAYHCLTANLVIRITQTIGKRLANLRAIRVALCSEGERRPITNTVLHISRKLD